MYMCMCICMCLYMYMYRYMYMYMYMCICIFVYAYVYVYTYIKSIYIHKYIYIYILCTNMYRHTHTSIHPRHLDMLFPSTLEFATAGGTINRRSCRAPGALHRFPEPKGRPSLCEPRLVVKYFCVQRQKLVTLGCREPSSGNLAGVCFGYSRIRQGYYMPQSEALISMVLELRVLRKPFVG